MDLRVDKWLWAVRIFKTRSKASEACRNGRVLIDKATVKASRMIKPGEEVEVKQPPIVRRFRVIGLAPKRVSAKLAANLVEEITPVEELERLKEYRKDPVSIIFGVREKGTGRPTKKERREMEKLLGQTGKHH